ncbi:uncharacterized protein PV09_03236 [Verruconis gallopava]|uniref:CoA-transferase family III n=1 Tax=Verruconis gallopava TaxID=253628 RepID=A0A0D2B4C1_9PEZI|nr:uncharacterized protein PV09_03236 [Verruconis gallopava]KIW06064.1 hypothetical protein PV09_03236 [Verruconis gallopava]
MTQSAARVVPGRTTTVARQIVHEIWTHLGLPSESLTSLELPGSGLGLPSSFQVGAFAQATIALSALAAATCHAQAQGIRVPRVSVPLRHASAEFKSERLYVLDGKTNEDPWGPIGGLHQTADGYVRIHDGFPHHRDNALKLLGLETTATREDVAQAAKAWRALDLEEAAAQSNAIVAALRSYSDWDVLEQAQQLPDLPITVQKVSSTPFPRPVQRKASSRGCLEGLRVLDLSRVIAAPIAGKTLAVHGADVLWVTSPNLPALPDIDCDVQRGKRTIQLDLKKAEDKAKLMLLLKEADVFLQGYRPGSLANLGLSATVLHEINPHLIVANLSAFGTRGPWSHRRGFDSIVQTCSGMNVSEAEHFGEGSPARPMPCQALDHGTGYLLATGIMAALYRRAKEGGAYVVDASLAGTMKYLRDLGQYEGNSGFDCEDIKTNRDVTEFLETRDTELGKLVAVKHSASIEGLDVGWRIMPKPLGSDDPKWLQAEESY